MCSCNDYLSYVGLTVLILFASLPSFFIELVSNATVSRKSGLILRKLIHLSSLFLHALWPFFPRVSSTLFCMVILDWMGLNIAQSLHYAQFMASEIKLLSPKLVRKQDALLITKVVEAILGLRVSSSPSSNPNFPSNRPQVML